jgi:hypothetical protein
MTPLYWVAAAFALGVLVDRLWQAASQHDRDAAMGRRMRG